MNDETRQTIQRLSALAVGRDAGDFQTAYREAVKSSDVVHALRDTGQLPSYNWEAVQTRMREHGMAASAAVQQGQAQAAADRPAPKTEAPVEHAGIQRVVEALKSTAAAAAADSPAPTPLAARMQSWREAETAERAAKVTSMPALETVAPTTAPARQSSSSPGVGM